ncbi:hypothetical protein [Nonomuraea angiospora]
MYEMKRLGRDAAELTALADRLTAHGLVLEMLAGQLAGIYDPADPAACCSRSSPPWPRPSEKRPARRRWKDWTPQPARATTAAVPPSSPTTIHTVLRRRAAGEPVEKIRRELIIPTGKRKGHNPSLASIYRALAEHEKVQRHPDAVEQARAEYAAFHKGL